jgi:hypothetical protein
MNHAQLNNDEPGTETIAIGQKKVLITRHEVAGVGNIGGALRIKQNKKQRNTNDKGNTCEINLATNVVVELDG